LRRWSSMSALLTTRPALVSVPSSRARWATNRARAHLGSLQRRLRP
jgi:hypothetical protein